MLNLMEAWSLVRAVSSLACDFRFAFCLALRLEELGLCFEKFQTCAGYGLEDLTECAWDVTVESWLRWRARFRNDDWKRLFQKILASKIVDIHKPVPSLENWEARN